MTQLIRKIILFILVCLSHQIPAVAKSDRNISSAQWQQLTNDKAFGYLNELEQVKQQQQPTLHQRHVEQRQRQCFTFDEWHVCRSD